VYLAKLVEQRELADKEPARGQALKTLAERGMQTKQALDDARIETAGAQQKLTERKSGLANLESHLRQVQVLVEAQRERERVRAALVEAEATLEEASIECVRLADEVKAFPIASEKRDQLEQHRAEREKLRTTRNTLEEDYQAVIGVWEQADREEANLAGQIQSRRKDAGDVAALAADVAVISRQIAAFEILDQSFGPDGIQKYEIDNAGPGVTEIVNDLLRDSWDGRFQVDLRTLSLSSRGDEKEDFQIVVIDSEAGREGTRFSPGERVIIEEAVRLGIAIRNKDMAKYDLRTLWRDESAGALSLKNANRYVQLLRAAMKRGGFDRAYFISHVPQVYEQADARIYFSTDGTVSID
jgi:exonuclease SbcC